MVAIPFPDWMRALPTMGATLGSQIYVWRSGIGVTANGALVYVGGPDLDINSLARLHGRAGSVRAMELDINIDWITLATDGPPSSNSAATPCNGSDLLSEMDGTPSRCFEPWWSRVFITLSVRTTG